MLLSYLNLTLEKNLENSLPSNSGYHGRRLHLQDNEIKFKVSDFRGMSHELSIGILANFDQCVKFMLATVEHTDS
jgi:hypothetical protein